MTKFEGTLRSPNFVLYSFKASRIRAKVIESVEVVNKGGYFSAFFIPIELVFEEEREGGSNVEEDGEGEEGGEAESEDDDDDEASDSSPSILTFLTSRAFFTLGPS